jgi:hypothetical protein
MRDEIVFVHIPKTAGTSVRKALEASATQHDQFCDYGRRPETTPELFQLVHVQKRPGLIREVLGRSRRRFVLSGHFPARRYWPYLRPESFITFIRKPVDRVVSVHNHSQRMRAGRCPSSSSPPCRASGTQ